MEVTRGEHFYKIDENGFRLEESTLVVEFIGDVLLTEVEDDEYIQSIIPQGLLRPRWTGEEWVEDMTPEEIEEAYRQPPTEPSENDILKAQNKALTDRLEFVEDLIAEMAMMIYD